MYQEIRKLIVWSLKKSRYGDSVKLKVRRKKIVFKNINSPLKVSCYLMIKDYVCAKEVSMR